MHSIKRLWVPLLAGLLIGGLLWSTNDGATAAVEPRSINRSKTISANAFTPITDDLSYENIGYQMVVEGPSTYGEFWAPIFFEAPEVRIRKIVLYAYDNGGQSVCVTLHRTVPKYGNEDDMATVCSTGASNGIRGFVEKTIDPKWAKEAHSPYLELYLPDIYSQGYAFYGLQIYYTIP
jgi:hypothetical protein